MSAEIEFSTDDRRRVSVQGIARFGLWGSLLVRDVRGWAWVRPSASVHLGRWERPQVRRFWKVSGLVRSTVVAAGPFRFGLDRLVGEERLAARIAAGQVQ